MGWLRQVGTSGGAHPIGDLLSSEQQSQLPALLSEHLGQLRLGQTGGGQAGVTSGGWAAAWRGTTAGGGRTRTRTRRTRTCTHRTRTRTRRTRG